MTKLLIICLLLAGPHLGRAQGTIFYNVFLDGASMVPSTSSTNSVAGTCHLSGNSFSCLIPFVGYFAVSGSIFGPASPGQTGPELFALNLFSVAPDPFNGDPGGFGFVASRTLTSTEVDQLNSGLWYVIANNAGFPGGELRGQIVAVQEPGTLALLSLGALLVVRVCWRARVQPV